MTLPRRSHPSNGEDDITLSEADKQCFCAAKVLSWPCLSWVKSAVLCNRRLPVQLPLCFVSDRDRAAVQYVARGQKLTFVQAILGVNRGDQRLRKLMRLISVEAGEITLRGMARPSKVLFRGIRPCLIAVSPPTAKRRRVLREAMAIDVGRKNRNLRSFLFPEWSLHRKPTEIFGCMNHLAQLDMTVIMIDSTIRRRDRMRYEKWRVGVL